MKSLRRLITKTPGIEVVNTLKSLKLLINSKTTKRGTRGGRKRKTTQGTHFYTLKNNNNKKQCNTLKSLTINFQSIWNKQEEFMVMLHLLQPDIVFGCETWLDEKVSNTELLFYDMYEIYRRDRKTDTRGGGVIILVKKDIESALLEEGKDHESIYCRIGQSRQRNIIGAIYRPPGCNNKENTSICTGLMKIKGRFKNCKLSIGGDFNLPDIDWSNNNVLGTQNPKQLNDAFLDTFSDLGLQQINNQPTRKSSVLDLYLTNEPDTIKNCSLVPGLGDHESAVMVTASTSAKKSKPPKRTIHLWKSADINKIKDDCQTFSQHFINTFNTTDNVEDLWQEIKGKLLTIIKNNVKTKTTSANWTKPWIDGTLKRLVRKKQECYRQMKRSESEDACIKYKEIKKITQKECRKAHVKHVTNLLDEDRSNKRLFSYIKAKAKGSNNNITELKDRHGTYHQDPATKANILNKQFCSVFSDSAQTSHFTTRNINNDAPAMRNINIHTKGVYKILKGLNEHKATGPDEIPSRLLKTCADELAPMLTLLFQASLDQGTVPADWKQAHVVPIYKKGDKASPENYRPVSLTSVCCKVLEHIVFSSIINYMEDNNFLTDVQHGFRRQRSCETQLITTSHDFINCLENKGQIDAILLDFSKAFDKVHHSSLLYKIKQYGIADNATKWIESFLIDRVQKVVIEGKESESVHVKSGVPQGTVLGPLLFLIYINDMPDALGEGTKLRLFADDSLLYKEINCISDAVSLQEELDKLQSWEAAWKMEFHPQKCQVLRITNKKNPIKSNYSIHNETLACTKDAKYLGVTLNEKMKWKKHVTNTANKASKTLSFLMRQLNHCHKSIKKKCYETYIRPILEYSSSVWDPHNKNEINELEKVQKRAARFVSGNFDYRASSEKLVQNLNWLTLAERRNINKVILFYKAQQDTIKIPIHHIEKQTSRTRNSGLNFVVPHSRTDIHLNSFFPSTIRLWNKLPTTTKQCSTIEQIKYKLGTSI